MIERVVLNSDLIKEHLLPRIKKVMEGLGSAGMLTAYYQNPTSLKRLTEEKSLAKEKQAIEEQLAEWAKFKEDKKEKYRFEGARFLEEKCRYEERLDEVQKQLTQLRAKKKRLHQTFKKLIDTMSIKQHRSASFSERARAFFHPKKGITLSREHLNTGP